MPKKHVENIERSHDLPAPTETRKKLETLAHQLIDTIHKFQTTEALTYTHSSQIEAVLRRIPGIEQFISPETGELDSFSIKEAMCNPAVVHSIANAAALPSSELDKIFENNPQLQPLLGLELGKTKKNEIRWLLRFGQYLRLQAQELRAAGDTGAAQGTEGDLFNFVLWTSERLFGDLDRDLQLLARGIDPTTSQADTVGFTDLSRSIIRTAVTTIDPQNYEELHAQVIQLLKGGDLALAKEALQNFALAPDVRQVMEIIQTLQSQNIDLVKTKIRLAGLVQAYYQAFGITTEQLYASEGIEPADLQQLLTDPELAQELGTAISTQAPNAITPEGHFLRYADLLPERAALLDFSNEPITTAQAQEIQERFLELFGVDEHNLLVLTSARPGSTVGAYTLEFIGQSQDVTVLILGAHNSPLLFTEVTAHELTHVAHAQAFILEEERCRDEHIPVRPGARFRVPQKVTEAAAQTTEHAVHSGSSNVMCTKEDIVNVVRDQMQIRKGIINIWLRYTIEQVLAGANRALTAAEVQTIYEKLTVQLANPAMRLLPVMINGNTTVLQLPEGYYSPLNYFNPLNPTEGAHYTPNNAVDFGRVFVEHFGTDWLYQPVALAIFKAFLAETLHEENHDVSKYEERLRALMAHSKRDQAEEA